jgi:hypothetical protein
MKFAIGFAGKMPDGAYLLRILVCIPLALCLDKMSLGLFKPRTFNADWVCCQPPR